MRDRFWAVLAVSVAVLSVEAVIGALALLVQEQTYENPGLPYNPLALLLLIVLAPLLAVAGAALGALLSVGLVMPVLVTAAWLGRRLAGREAWWWVPATAATVFCSCVTSASPTRRGCPWAWTPTALSHPTSALPTAVYVKSGGTAMCCGASWRTGGRMPAPAWSRCSEYGGGARHGVRSVSHLFEPFRRTCVSGYGSRPRQRRSP
ncbi:hypothetical protein OG349_19170 [Streptomyces sp. NBC_01317]|uniref:hypothetical protein n=1 Tax=Streptomyces sp. NBC_01317 TaxID=2903822 RepID=UPI002E1200FF|nr:hypothetical protein OG349_19170 [Streptomyces sp. NBC_01317]